MFTPVIILFLAVLVHSEKCFKRCPDHLQCMSLMECWNNTEIRSTHACGFNSGQMMVCCQLLKRPTRLTDNERFRIPVETSFEIAKKKCNEYIERQLAWHLPPDIIAEIAGNPAQPKEYAHMALIGYGVSSPKWLCGGSLISEKFVLSAAHCSKILTRNAEWVRLGDLDFRTDTDDAQPEEFRIIRRINHLLYEKYYYDVALFELERTVIFSSYIQPACLHVEELIQGEDVIATGWGKSEKSVLNCKGEDCQHSHLIELFLKIAGYDACQNSFKNYLPKGIDPSVHICAGANPGRSCQGDSGGPLQIHHPYNYNMFSLVGITSFGLRDCLEGHPSVFAKIRTVVPWIVNIVWPQG